MHSHLQETKKESTSINFHGVFIAGSGIVLLLDFLLVGVFLFLTNLLEGFSWSVEKAGAFGDIFGAVNALVSGLAFVALVITLLMQGRDLRLQQRTLIASLDETKKSVGIFEEQLAVAAQASLLSVLPTLCNSTLREIRQVAPGYFDTLDEIGTDLEKQRENFEKDCLVNEELKNQKNNVESLLSRYETYANELRDTYDSLKLSGSSNGLSKRIR